MILLTKKEFVDYLQFMYDQEKKQEQFVHALENLCPGNYCDCWLYNDYMEKYLELIKKLMNDKNDCIRFFLFDMEKGKAPYYQNLKGDDRVPYYTEDELYDWLVKEDETYK